MILRADEPREDAPQTAADRMREVRAEVNWLLVTLDPGVQEGFRIDAPGNWSSHKNLDPWYRMGVDDEGRPYTGLHIIGMGADKSETIFRPKVHTFEDGTTQREGFTIAFGPTALNVWFENVTIECGTTAAIYGGYDLEKDTPPSDWLTLHFTDVDITDAGEKTKWGLFTYHTGVMAERLTIDTPKSQEHNYYKHGGGDDYFIDCRWLGAGSECVKITGRPDYRLFTDPDQRAYAAKLEAEGNAPDNIYPHPTENPPTVVIVGGQMRNFGQKGANWGGAGINFECGHLYVTDTEMISNGSLPLQAQPVGVLAGMHGILHFGADGKPGSYPAIGHVYFERVLSFQEGELYDWGIHYHDHLVIGTDCLSLTIKDCGVYGVSTKCSIPANTPARIVNNNSEAMAEHARKRAEKLGVAINTDQEATFIGRDEFGPLSGIRINDFQPIAGSASEDGPEVSKAEEDRPPPPIVVEPEDEPLRRG